MACGAPPVGSVTTSIVFISIGAHTITSPLTLGMTEPDMSDTLDQFHAKNLIYFEGVDNPNIESVFFKCAEEEKSIIRRVRIIGDSSPYLFRYIDNSARSQMINRCVPLVNPKNFVCLLLRISYNLVRPKGVPLRQGSLVTNGAIIAESMKLQENDGCYSVMPLFHIGVISTSIMCTMASGGSVFCNSEPFDPSCMVDALVLSNPQPMSQPSTMLMLTF